MRFTRGFFASLRMTAEGRLRPAFALFLFGIAILASTGCSHYQLGTDSKLTFATLYVEPVANKTLVPQAQASLSARLREHLARDGRVTLVNSAQGADATLTVVITSYEREVATVREGDTGLARKFTLSFGASCTLRDNRSGKVLFANRPVTTHRDAFTGGEQNGVFVSDQLQSEFQTLPLLTESLADRIAHAVLDVW
ncbi:MAG TPA: LPS assembly lipoprotein LptE [Opitutaceae bacterium]|nr:LPS assembly lipoprotein LptE [Opitutaceae bacterium]